MSYAYLGGVKISWPHGIMVALHSSFLFCFLGGISNLANLTFFIVRFSETSRFNDFIFTLAYHLDDIVFAPADSFGHILTFFLPGVCLSLGALAGFCQSLGSLVFQLKAFIFDLAACLRTRLRGQK